MEETISRSNSTSQNGKKTPSNYNPGPDQDQSGNSMTQTPVSNMNTRKSKILKNPQISTNGSIDQSVNGTSQQDTGPSGVFKRLSVAKDKTTALRDNKKGTKKEAEVNFFDNTYTQTIIGIFLFLI